MRSVLKAAASWVVVMLRLLCSLVDLQVLAAAGECIKHRPPSVSTWVKSVLLNVGMPGLPLGALASILSASLHVQRAEPPYFLAYILLLGVVVLEARTWAL